MTWIIEKELKVHKITYSVDVGEQKDTMKKEDLDASTSFERGADSGKKHELRTAAPTTARYDLVHEIAERTHLTRKTIVAILIGTKSKLQCSTTTRKNTSPISPT